jgi:hypothetical protein
VHGREGGPHDVLRIDATRTREPGRRRRRRRRRRRGRRKGRRRRRKRRKRRRNGGGVKSLCACGGV